MALLWREKRMTKDQFLDLSDNDLFNWVGRPSIYHDPSKPYWPVPRSDPDAPPSKIIGTSELYMNSPKAKALRTMGASEAEIEEAYQKWLKDG